MKKLLHIFWSCLEVFIIIYVIILTSFILSRNSFGYTQFGNKVLVYVSIWDVRNIENVDKNDLLVIRTTDYINENDLLYYYAVSNEKYVVRSNRILNIIKNDEGILYQIDDNEKSYISANRVIGTYSVRFSKLGGLFSFLESGIGFLIFALIPIIIVFAYQLFDFIITVKNEKRENLEKNKYYFEPVIDKVIDEKDESVLKSHRDDDIEIL